jgi:hypothetical protein
MIERSRTGLAIVAVAMFLGIFGNLMLRETPWGLNAAVFVLMFTLTLGVVTYRRRRELLTLSSIALMGAMIFFGAMFVIRDSVELRAYDTFAVIIIMGILVLPNFGINQRIAGVFHYGAGLAWSGISVFIGPFFLAGADIDWKDLPRNRLSRNVFSVLRGLALALPLLLIFGALFMAADAAFENFANRMVRLDADTIVSHVLLTSFLAWLTAGYFRSALIDHFAENAAGAVSVVPASDKPIEETATADEGRSFVEKFAAEPGEDSSLPNHATVLEHINFSDAPNVSDEPSQEPAGESDASAETPKRDWQNWDNTKIPKAFTLGRVEMVIILGLINLLFLSFVIFQLPYLFGGMDLVQNTPDLKLAEFARRGFGELVAVSFLVLPLLLFSHWLLRREDARNESIFRILAGVQVVLLFVIMASAMQRLVLLTGSLGYGWTTVRFYPMVVMIWLAIVFVWFGWTVLRGRRQHFAWGALWSAIVILAVTNLMNPDDFIARKNIGLMQQGREYDAVYNARLSDDAMAAVVEALPLMRADDQCATMSVLYRRLLNARGEGDVRSLNWSRERAFDLLESRSGNLANGTLGSMQCENYRPWTQKFLGEYGR